MSLKYMLFNFIPNQRAEYNSDFEVIIAILEIILLYPYYIILEKVLLGDCHHF